jgi:hypothetical protein
MAWFIAQSGPHIQASISKIECITTFFAQISAKKRQPERATQIRKRKVGVSNQLYLERLALHALTVYRRPRDRQVEREEKTQMNLVIFTVNSFLSPLN